MLNPDGVIVGNYRCSGLGEDLNRRWSVGDPLRHPELVAVRSLLKAAPDRCAMFLDIHGHSVKRGTFTFGVAAPSETGDSESVLLRHRSLPRSFSRTIKGFKQENCIYKIGRTKQSTGRAVMANEFKVPYSYTLEISLAGFEDRRGESHHYDLRDLREIGTGIVQGLWAWKRAEWDTRLILQTVAQLGVVLPEAGPEP